MTIQSNNSNGKTHQFGGDWTSAKLDVIAKYLSAYTTALKNTPFKTGYIDAFAGTGYREPRKDKAENGSEQLVLPDLAKAEPQQLLDGSARRALGTDPRFDKYIFIESNADRCRQLEQLKIEFPDLSDVIDIHQGDANEEIQKLCSENKDWSKHRAVLFLDPYGMQVEWATIEAIAKTKAIDLWILFPLGIGVNRLLTRSGDIPKSWRNRLDLLLGSSDWYEAFYHVEVSRDLFGNEQERLIKAKTDKIGEYFLKRLRTVFPAIAPNPGVLRNSTNCPLYLLCFAVGSENPRAQGIALNVANHILKEVR